MLVALTDQNERFVLKTSMPHEYLKQLRQTSIFYCPQCKEPLQFKIGTLKIPHFAHLSKNKCEQHFSDGESEQHLLGKEQLYEFFQAYQLKVELEPYLPNLKQRPDLLVTAYNGTRYAIEFQCSSITTERLNERNKGYHSEKIKPIWIPQTPVKKNFKKNGIQAFSINHNLQQFILFNGQQSYLITYSPLLQEFIYLSNLLHVSGNLYLTKVQALKVDQQRFPFYLTKQLTSNEFFLYMKAYDDLKARYMRSRVLVSRKGVQDLFLRSIYELRLNINSLPIFIGVPLKGNEAMNIFSTEWQAILLYFGHLHEVPISMMKRSLIRYFLKWANLPETENALKIVEVYCDFLQQLKIENVYSSVSSDRLVFQLYNQFLANNWRN
ncbi:competence protein CoiA [Ureibacillus sp. NPDC094379]